MKKNIKHFIKTIIDNKLVRSKKGMTKALQIMLENIEKAIAGGQVVPPEKFDKWFEGSKVVDKKGIKKSSDSLVSHDTPDINIGQLAEEAGIDFSKEEFTPEALRQGYKIELEHTKDSETKITNDPVDVVKIAWAHLRENKVYYTKLNEMESEMKKAEQEHLELEHWSSVPDLDVIDPLKHGTGYLGEERKRKAAFPDSFVPRSYFYSKGTQPEGGLGPHKYSVVVPKGHIYDMTKDPDNLKVEMNDDFNNFKSWMEARNEYETKVRSAGYRGAYLGHMGRTGEGADTGHVYIMFGPERVKKVEPEVKKSEQDAPLPIDIELNGNRPTDKNTPNAGRIEFQGIPVIIENLSGSQRSWKDRNGKSGVTRMFNSYGYIPGTKAQDGEGIDVYLGPYLDADTVFVITQMKPEGGVDEIKTFLGFRDEGEVTQCYRIHMNDPKRMGEINKISMESFKQQVQDMRMSKSLGSESLPDPTVETVMLGQHGRYFSIISAEKSDKKPEENADRTRSLEDDLIAGAHYYSPQDGGWADKQGHYGEEKSFLVFGPHQKEVERLGQKYDQESVIHSNGEQHEEHFVTGENAGKHHKGLGHELLDNDKKHEFWSRLNGQKYKLKIDREHFFDSEDSVLSKYEDVNDLFKAQSRARFEGWISPQGVKHENEEGHLQDGIVHMFRHYPAETSRITNESSYENMAGRSVEGGVYDHPAAQSAIQALINHGWVGYGHGGEHHAHVSDEVLDNPHHPAISAIKKLHEEHVAKGGEPVLRVWAGGREHAVPHRNVMAGNLKKPSETQMYRSESDGDLFKAARAKRALAPDDLMHLLKNGNDEQRARVIKDEGINEQHLDVAINDQLAIVRDRAYNNEKLTPAQIDKALEKETNFGAIQTLARHKNLTADNITRALTGKHKGQLGSVDINFGLVEFLSGHPNLTPEHINILLDHPKERIRSEAAAHKNASSANIHKAISLCEGESERGDNVTIAISALHNANHTADDLTYALDVSDRNNINLYPDIVQSKHFNAGHITQVLNGNKTRWSFIADHPLVTDEHIDKILNKGDAFVRYVVFGGLAVSEKSIDRGLSDPDKDIRRHAIKNDGVNSEHIERALKDKDPQVRMSAAASPKATKEQAVSVLDRAAETGNLDDIHVAEYAIPHPELGPKEIKSVLRNKGEDFALLRQAATEHPNNDEDSLSMALDDSERSVQMSAAEHKNLTPKNINKVLKMKGEKFYQLQRQAATHENADSENLMTALKSDSGEVRGAATLNKNIGPEHVEFMANSDNPRLRLAATHSDKASPAVIEKLLNDQFADIRHRMAANPNLTDSQMTRVLVEKDKFDEMGRQAVLKNKNHTSEHVGIAANDPDPEVRRAAARSNKATPEHLQKFLEVGIHERASAIENKNLTTDQLQQVLDEKYSSDSMFDIMHHPNINEKQIASALAGEYGDTAKELAIGHPNIGTDQLIKYGNFTGQKEFKGRSLVYSHIKDRLKAFDKDSVSKQEYGQKHPEDKSLPEFQKIFQTGKAGVAEVEHARSEEPGQKYLTSEGEWFWGAQMHNDKREQVFRFDIHPDQYNKYSGKEKEILHKVVGDAQTSGHPVNPDRPTIGWARVDTSNKNHWFIDEIQSDVGKKLKTDIYEQAKKNNIDVPDDITNAAIKFAGDFQDFGHHMLAHVMEEAHKKGVKKVSIHSNASKNLHLGRYDPKQSVVKWTREAAAKRKKENGPKTWNDPDEPVSTQTEMYEKAPKPAGFQPMPYTDLPTKGPKDLGQIYTRDVIEKALMKALLNKAIMAGYKVTPEMYKAFSRGKSYPKPGNLNTPFSNKNKKKPSDVQMYRSEDDPNLKKG